MPAKAPADQGRSARSFPQAAPRQLPGALSSERDIIPQITLTGRKKLPVISPLQPLSTHAPPEGTPPSPCGSTDVSRETFRANPKRHASPAPSPAGARRGAARRWSPREHRSGGDNEAAAFLPPFLRQERPPLTFHAPCVPAPRALRTLRPRPARLVRPCGACPSAPRASSHPCPFSHLAPPSSPPRPSSRSAPSAPSAPPAQPVRLPRAPYAASHPCPRAPCAPLLPRPIASLALAPLRVFASPRASRACPPRPHAPRIRACRSYSLGRHGNVVFPLYSDRQSIGFCAMLEAQLDERGRRRRIDLCGQKRAARRTFSQQTSRCAHPLSSAVFYSLRAKR